MGLYRRRELPNSLLQELVAVSFLFNLSNTKIFVFDFLKILVDIELKVMNLWI